MKRLDRSRVYSEVAGSFNGYEQDGVLFLKSGVPFEPETEKLEEPQKKEAMSEIKEQTEQNTDQVKKLAAKKLEGKPVKKRRGRPAKKNPVIAVSETETLPETHPIMPEKSRQEKNYARNSVALEQTQITDDNEVII
jgi:hypothetical protein